MKSFCCVVVDDLKHVQSNHSLFFVVVVVVVVDDLKHIQIKVYANAFGMLLDCQQTQNAEDDPCSAYAATVAGCDTVLVHSGFKRIFILKQVEKVGSDAI